MNKSLKNNRLKNTGILFELLTRQVTSDVLSNRKAKASTLITKFFHGTELAKEYTLYNTIITANLLEEKNADTLLQAVQEAYRKVDHTKVEKEKYQLIREINENYSGDFFKARVPNYPVHASIYNLLKSTVSNEFVSPTDIVKNKTTLLEHLTKKSDPEPEPIMEYKKLGKGERALVYRLMVDKFNEKYGDLPQNRKEVLFEYVTGISNDEKLTSFVGERLLRVRHQLMLEVARVEDEDARVKLDEVVASIRPFRKGYVVKDSDINGLLGFYDLLDELKDANRAD